LVKAPADIPWKIRKLATDVAHKAVSSLEGAGVFAVELFLTKDGQVVLVFFSVFHFICTIHSIILSFRISGTCCL
jgi:formate-dependent phosphoribosylglycinamide formyltransferase (GAR transformylase)